MLAGLQSANRGDMTDSINANNSGVKLFVVVQLRLEWFDFAHILLSNIYSKFSSRMFQGQSSLRKVYICNSAMG